MANGTPICAGRAAILAIATCVSAAAGSLPVPDACPTHTSPLPCVVGHGGSTACRRAAVCPGRWTSQSNLVAWVATDPACRVHVESGAEAALAFRGRTISFIGDSVTQQIQERTREAIAGSGGAREHVWHAVGYECDERYNKSVRADVHCELRGGNGIRWRSFFLKYLRDWWPGGEKRDQWDDVIATADDARDVIIVNTGAWDLNFQVPESYPQGVNATMAMIAMLPAATRRQLQGALLWRPMLPSEYNTTKMPAWTDSPSLVARTSAAWRAAGFTVLDTSSFKLDNWSSVQGFKMTIDGLHPRASVRFLVGRYVLAAAFEAVVLRQRRSDSDGGHGDRFVSAGAQLLLRLPDSTDTAVLAGLIGAAAVTAAAVALVRRSTRSADAGSGERRASAGATGDRGNAPRPHFTGGRLPALLVCFAVLVLAAGGVAVATLYVGSLDIDASAAVPVDGVRSGYAGAAAHSACAAVATAVAWLLPPRACTAPSGAVLTPCIPSPGAPGLPRAATSPTTRCRHAIETHVEFALAFHDAALVFVGGHTAARLLAEYAKLAWACEPLNWRPVPLFDSEASMFVLPGGRFSTYAELRAPARQLCRDVSSPTVDGRVGGGGNGSVWAASLATGVGRVRLLGALLPSVGAGGGNATAWAIAAIANVTAAVQRRDGAASVAASDTGTHAPSRVHVVITLADLPGAARSEAVIAAAVARALEAAASRSDPGVLWYVHWVMPRPEGGGAAASATVAPPYSSAPAAEGAGDTRIFVDAVHGGGVYSGDGAPSDAEAAAFVVNSVWATARSTAAEDCDGGARPPRP